MVKMSPTSASSLQLAWRRCARYASMIRRSPGVAGGVVRLRQHEQSSTYSSWWQQTTKPYSSSSSSAAAAAATRIPTTDPVGTACATVRGVLRTYDSSRAFSTTSPTPIPASAPAASTTRHRRRRLRDNVTSVATEMDDPTALHPPSADAHHHQQLLKHHEEDDESTTIVLNGKGKPLGIRHEAVTDIALFQPAASALLDKLYDALKPLESINDPFVLVRGVEGANDDEEYGKEQLVEKSDNTNTIVNGNEYLLLDLGPIHGQYSLHVDVEQCLVLLSSPISGQIYYVLSHSTRNFCGLEDGHALEGLLVRDLIRQIYGVPNL